MLEEIIWAALLMLRGEEGKDYTAVRGRALESEIVRDASNLLPFSNLEVDQVEWSQSDYGHQN